MNLGSFPGRSEEGCQFNRSMQLMHKAFLPASRTPVFVWPFMQPVCHGVQHRLRVTRQVSAFGKILPELAVAVRGEYAVKTHQFVKVCFNTPIFKSQKFWPGLK